MSEQPTNDLETQPDEQPETIEAHIPEPIFETHHQWKQEGPYLRCRSCAFSHATYIGVERQLVGIDEGGLPILKAL